MTRQRTGKEPMKRAACCSREMVETIPLLQVRPAGVRRHAAGRGGNRAGACSGLGAEA
jgi:hypothetical protein